MRRGTQNLKRDTRATPQNRGTHTQRRSAARICEAKAMTLAAYKRARADATNQTHGQPKRAPKRNETPQTSVQPQCVTQAQTQWFWTNASKRNDCGQTQRQRATANAMNSTRRRSRTQTHTQARARLRAAKAKTVQKILLSLPIASRWLEFAEEHVT